MTKPVIEPIANYHCHTGENPLWDSERALLFWTDIPAGKLFRYNPKSGEHAQMYSGDPVGGFTLQVDGSLLLFRVNEIARFHLDGQVESLVKDIDDDMERFNDVIADPAGRVFAGTIGQDAQRGGLYRVDLDGSVTRLFQGTGCANGMGFTPDRGTFYWTCSTTRKIFKFDYDQSTGNLTNRRVFLAVGEGEGTPDGLVVDTEGTVWSARWNGYGIYKYSPEGELLEKIEFPVAAVSSLIFGGAELNEIYVTTAQASKQPKPEEGTLYRVRVSEKGQPEYRSRVLTG